MDEKELEFRRKRLETSHQAEEERQRLFWAETYPTFSNDDKARFWASSIRTQMRYNGESGYDEEWAFSGDYEAFKQQEPDLDNLLEDIAKYLRYKPEDFIRILKEGK